MLTLVYSRMEAKLDLFAQMAVKGTCSIRFQS
jgi:hypothetical protein